MINARHSMVVRLAVLVVLTSDLITIRAVGDTVKLNDGTVLEGDIVQEDASQIIIEVEFASGSIKQTRTVDKFRYSGNQTPYRGRKDRTPNAS